VRESLQASDADDLPDGFGILQQNHVDVCGSAQHRYEICPYRQTPKKMMRKTAEGAGSTTTLDILPISLSCFGANVA
jgi:hypothetical protein